MTLLQKVLNWFKSSASKVSGAIDWSIDLLNKGKKYADSPLIDVVVKATATTADDALVAAIRSGLTGFINVLGWTKKTLKDFEIDEDAKTLALTALSAKASVIKADYDKVKLTMQQAVASVPVAYNEAIVK